MQRIEIDQETCIGCGNCESVCPEVFVLGEQVKSSVVDEYRTEEENMGEAPDDIGCVKSAEEGCPVNAIDVK